MDLLQKAFFAAPVIVLVQILKMSALLRDGFGFSCDTQSLHLGKPTRKNPYTLFSLTLSCLDAFEKINRKLRHYNCMFQGLFSAIFLSKQIFC